MIFVEEIADELNFVIINKSSKHIGHSEEVATGKIDITLQRMKQIFLQKKIGKYLIAKNCWTYPEIIVQKI